MLESVSQNLTGPLFTHDKFIFVCEPLVEEHIEQIVSIENTVHQSPWSAKLFLQCLSGRQLCFVVLAQDVNSEQTNRCVVAYVVITLAGPDAEILNLAVSDSWQHKGLGRALLQRATSALKLQSQIIYLEVRESNHRAIALYSSENFVEVGIRENYYPAKKGREDAIIFALTLSENF